MNIHFIGIGGSGISGVARLAERSGFTVSGCDKQESSAYGENILKGHSATHIKGADLVVTSPALFYTTENPEIDEARKNGKLITWQKFVADFLCVNKKVVCIAGTHGKSTTTAMVGQILETAGLDPMVVIGANVSEWGGNYRFGEGNYIVIEADEFNDNFLNYNPDVIIINNIEFDHPDYFESFDEVKASFAKFTARLKKNGILITEKDNPHKKFNLKVPGAHNQNNANMAYVLAKKLNIDDKEIVRALQNFTGIGRRMEKIADRGGIKVFDDYAHHPTAVKTTIEGLRDLFKDSRIVVVYEPHGFLRTKALLGDYKNVFDDADKVYIGPIFQARDKKDEKVTPYVLAKSISHKNVTGYVSFDNILENIRMDFQEKDIILVMGAGESYKWARKIAAELPVSFKDLTTFRVGGKIKNYVEINDEAGLISAINEIKKNNQEIFILGEGSDILVSDKDFRGTVIKYTKSDIRFEDEIVSVGAGAQWDKVVDEAIKRGLWGIECLSGIPGTAGAAPIQNIGAYGQEISETFLTLRAYDIKKGAFVEFNKSECGFNYRDSIFKKSSYWQKYVITQIKLKLSLSSGASIKYESLGNYLKVHGIKNPTLQQIRSAVLDIRSHKFENPKTVGNAGSFFKNPVVEESVFEKIITKNPDLAYFKTDRKYKIFAGWLIEKAGWKGAKYKTAGVSPNHALILINPEGLAKAADVYELSEKIISDVYKKFSIKLEREVQLINFQ